MRELVESTPLLLNLYRAARELTEREFQDAGLRLVRPLIRFDCAVWGTGTTDGNTIEARSAYLDNIDPESLSDWRRVNGKDKTIRIVTSHMGRTVQFRPALHAPIADTAFREYVTKWKRKVHLATALAERAPGAIQWMSLYRYRDAEYSERERALSEMLMPHLAEALRINRALTPALVRTADLSDEPLLALFDMTGHLVFAQEGFQALLTLEWAGFESEKLPAPILDALANERRATFCGKSIKMRIRRSADCLLIEAELKSALDRLPTRRAAVAQLFAAGHSYKDIAKRLRIAPSTVRNQIAAAYRDLGVATKAQLAELGRRPD